MTRKICFSERGNNTHRRSRELSLIDYGHETISDEPYDRLHISGSRPEVLGLLRLQTGIDSRRGYQERAYDGYAVGEKWGTCYGAGGGRNTHR